MLSILKKILISLICNHKYEQHSIEYHNNILSDVYICNKCGKIKKIKHSDSNIRD